MKISNTTPSYINQTYTGQMATGAHQQSKSQRPVDETLTDSINLSGRTKDLQKISKALEAEPADREKYVADIKYQVENNQYDINAEAVAEKMVGQLFNEIG